jgi:hypothetical protein
MTPVEAAIKLLKLGVRGVKEHTQGEKNVPAGAYKILTTARFLGHDSFT